MNSVRAPAGAEKHPAARPADRDHAVGGRRGWLMRRMLLIADVLTLSLSFVTVELVFGSTPGPHDTLGLGTEFVLFFVSIPGWIVLAKLYSLYTRDEERADHSTGDELIGVFHLVTVGAFLSIATAWVSGLIDPTPGKVISFWALAVITMTVGRASARIVCRRSSAYVQSAVIVGAGDVGQLIALKLLRHPEYKVEVLGFIDAEPRTIRFELRALKLLGAPSDLPRIIKSLGVDRVIIAFSKNRHDETIALVRSLSEYDICVDVVPRLFSLVSRNTGVHNIEGLPLMALPRPSFARSTLFIKRTTDVILSAIGLLILAPAFIVIAARIKLDSRGPVLFHQTRMGEGGHPFQLLKFRTMVVDAEQRKSELTERNQYRTVSDLEARLFKVADDPRVTQFGRFLRRYSLDEFPQLINVLRGQMSLVGPRPLVLDEDRYVVDWRRMRLHVKPGMTGAWQVFGRDAVAFEEMVELDYRYVSDWSMVDDLSLLVRTLPAITRQRSAY